jgi:hypothetical protein
MKLCGRTRPLAAGKLGHVIFQDLTGFNGGFASND